VTSYRADATEAVRWTSSQAWNIYDALPVFAGENRHALEWPFDPTRLVIPDDALFMLRGVVIGGFIQALGNIGQHAESVRKPFRYSQLPFILRREHLTDPLPKRR